MTQSTSSPNGRTRGLGWLRRLPRALVPKSIAAQLTVLLLAALLGLTLW